MFSAKSTPTNSKRSITAIRGISTPSLLKLLSIGFLAGTFPFIVLVNFGVLISPTAVSEDIKRAIGFPGVLIGWPILSICAAWVATFFVSVGLQIIFRFRPIRITLLLDEPKA